MRYCLVVREDESSEDHIMATVPKAFESLREAYGHFSSCLSGMGVHSSLPENAPCGGFFTSDAPDFPGKFWEIVGALSDRTPCELTIPVGGFGALYEMMQAAHSVLTENRK